MNTVLHDTARMNMWGSLIPNYYGMTKQQKKKAKEKYAEAHECMPHEVCWTKEAMEEYKTVDDNDILNLEYTEATTFPKYLDLDCFKTVPCHVEQAPVKPKGKEKEHTMGYYDPKTPTELETEQRNHLKKRVDSVYHDLYNAIGTKFNLVEPDGPTTKDALMAALKAGQFTLKDSYFDTNGNLRPYGRSEYAISWRTTPFDQVGYDDAMHALGIAYTQTRDKVKILPVVDGLAALQAFEAYTI